MLDKYAVTPYYQQAPAVLAASIMHRQDSKSSFLPLNISRARGIGESGNSNEKLMHLKFIEK